MGRGQSGEEIGEGRKGERGEEKEGRETQHLSYC